MEISKNVKLILDLSLGDGGVYYMNAATKAIFQTTHSIKQIDYAMWKRNIIAQAGYEVSGVIRTWPNGKQGYNIFTKSHTDMNTVHDLLYDKRKKVFKKELFNHLDSRSLAFFFMDDGYASTRNVLSGKYERRYYTQKALKWYGFSTYAFNDEEQANFIHWLYNSFNIYSYIQKQSNGKVIAIGRKSDQDTFRDLVSPFIIDSMRYKINFPHSFAGISYTTQKR